MRGTRTHCSSACPLSYAQAHRHLPQPWGYGHHLPGSRMQQRTRINITRPLKSTHSWFDSCNSSILATFCRMLYSSSLLIVPEYLLTKNSGRPLVARYKAFQSNLSTYRRERSGCCIIFRRYLVIVYARCCHLLQRRHIFLS